MELNEEEKREAERLFNLRRRIYDYRNGKDWPEGDNQMIFDIEIDGVEIRTKDLSNQDIFALVVISNDLRDYGTNKRNFSFTKWSNAYITKLAKQEQAIRCDTLWNVDEGTISGKGYIINGAIRNEMNRMYEEHLWNELPIPENSRFNILLSVEMQNVFTGSTIFAGLNEDKTKVNVCRPQYYIYRDMVNWEKDEKGRYKERVSIDWKCVKKWRVS